MFHANYPLAHSNNASHFTVDRSVDTRDLRLLLIYGLLSACMLWPTTAHLLANIPHVCLFESIFGIPCPGCDVTSSLLYLAHGDIMKSINTQPTGTLFGITLVAESIIRAGRLLRLFKPRGSILTIQTLETVLIIFALLYWAKRIVNLTL